MKIKRKNILTGILTFISIAATGICQPMTTFAKEDEQRVTPSGIVYCDLQQEIDNFIEERKDGCASVCVEVFHGNTTICKTQYGYSDLGNHTQVGDDTVYEWGSVSKLLVWTSVMQLYEQGELDLEADIRGYLPDGFLKNLKYNEPITMLNLMNHNAGWQETAYDVETKVEAEIIPLEEALQYCEPAQIYRPGTVTAYSNWGNALAAYIVQRISGIDYVAYVHENILKPLGMEHTSVAADYCDNLWVRKQRSALRCYAIGQDYFETYGTAIHYVLLYPAGSVTGTLDDFAVFAKAFTSPSGQPNPLFQKPETLTLLKTATSYYGDTQIARNCHGFWTNQYKEDIIGHSGNTSGCTSTLMLQPKSGLGIVIMTNEMGETAFNYGLLSLIYGDYEDNERIVGQKITEGEELSGIYTSARSFEKGFASIYKYMGGLMPLQKGVKDGEFKVMLADGTLTQIADHQYLMDNHNGWRYLMYETTDQDGNVILQMMSTDIIRENTITFYLKLLSIIGMVLTVLASTIILVVKVIAVFIRLITKKKSYLKQNMLSEIPLCANVVIGLVLYRMILLPLDGYTVKPMLVMLQCIVIAVLSILSIFSAFSCLKRKKDQRARFSHLLPAVMSSFTFLFVLYWRLLVFWGC